MKLSLKKEEGLKSYNIKIEEETLEKIAIASNGDVRTALNGLEVAVLTTELSSDGCIHIPDEDVAQSMQNRKAIFD